MTYMSTEVVWWIPSLLTLLGILMGYLAHAQIQKARGASARHSAASQLAEAELAARNIRHEAELDVRKTMIDAREAFEQERGERRRELSMLEDRLMTREINLDRRIKLIDTKKDELDAAIAAAALEQQRWKEQQASLQNIIAEQQHKIQEIAALTQEDARRLLLAELQLELDAEKGVLIRRAQEESKATAEQKAKHIISLAIQRYAAEHVNSVTTTMVNLPNEDMKGRIIGKEGRNIRSLEAETGCNILIDETPEVVVVSCFDPIRREIARHTLERLIEDGRIHPARIEEVHAKVKEEIDEIIRQAGEAAIYDLKLRDVPPELVRTLGRLKYRHSYAQNVLTHSVEMGHLMGMMAAEIGLDIAIAKRVGLFHDIGKALDHTAEGSHAIIGADLLRRHGESPIICNAVAAHHEEVEIQSVYAVLASAADALTAARPGARSETTENYLHRLDQIERIAMAFRGVQKCYAIQAGRELRVLVEPAKIDDNESMTLARNISHQIQQNIKYPGQIKVTVIRETRCIEYARPS